MKKIFAWVDRNDTPIRWFFVGFFVYGAMDAFGRGNWVATVINLLFAVANYWIWRR